jgi:PAS domain S-box-containing protein
MPNNNNKKIPDVNASEERIVDSKPPFKHTEARYKAVLEGTNAGTWEWNIQTGETVFNERWAQIIGYTLKELTPTTIDTWIKYTHPMDLNKCQEKLESHFRGEQDYYECECRMKHKDGHIQILQDSKRHKKSLKNKKMPFMKEIKKSTVFSRCLK